MIISGTILSAVGSAAVSPEILTVAKMGLALATGAITDVLIQRKIDGSLSVGGAECHTQATKLTLLRGLLTAIMLCVVMGVIWGKILILFDVIETVFYL